MYRLGVSLVDVKKNKYLYSLSDLKTKKEIGYITRVSTNVIDYDLPPENELIKKSSRVNVVLLNPLRITQYDLEVGKLNFGDIIKETNKKLFDGELIDNKEVNLKDILN